MQQFPYSLNFFLNTNCMPFRIGVSSQGNFFSTNTPSKHMQTFLILSVIDASTLSTSTLVEKELSHMKIKALKQYATWRIFFKADFDTEISFKDPELVQSKSFEMYQHLQPFRKSSFYVGMDERYIVMQQFLELFKHIDIGLKTDTCSSIATSPRILNRLLVQA